MAGASIFYLFWYFNTNVFSNPTKYMGKKASDDYIHLNKKITTKVIVNHLKILAKEKGKTEKEICYDLIIEGVMRDFDRRKK